MCALLSYTSSSPHTSSTTTPWWPESGSGWPAPTNYNLSTTGWTDDYPWRSTERAASKSITVFCSQSALTPASETVSVCWTVLGSAQELGDQKHFACRRLTWSHVAVTKPLSRSRAQYHLSHSSQSGLDWRSDRSNAYMHVLVRDSDPSKGCTTAKTGSYLWFYQKWQHKVSFCYALALVFVFGSPSQTTMLRTCTTINMTALPAQAFLL